MMLKHPVAKFPLLVCGVAFFSILALVLLWFGVFQHFDNGLAFLYKSGFAISIIGCIVAFFALRKKILHHPERLFLIGLLSLTCLSSWAYDTNEVSWDLESHYRFALEYADVDRTYELTEADESVITRELQIENEDERKRFLDSSLLEEGNAIVFANINIWTDAESLRTKDVVLDEIANQPDNEERTVSGSMINLYKRIANLPASVILFITSLLGVPFSARFVIAKLIYALIYSFVLYFGMKKLRSGKMIFATLALYPTAVFLASNYSYDFWVNAWTMYAVASIVGIMQRPDKIMQTREGVKILLAFFVGLAPKAIYFPLVILCFFISKKHFSSRKQLIMFRFGTLLCLFLVLFSFLIPFLFSSASGTNTGDTRGGSDVNPVAQVQHILSDPLGYLAVWFNFSIDFLSIPSSRNYITYLAYLGKGSGLVWLCFLLIGLFSTITDTRFSSTSNTWRTRLASIFIVIFTLGLAMTSLYVSFTPVGSGTIAGFQGRYILPLLFPLLIFVGTSRLSWPRSKASSAICTGATLMVLFALDYYSLWVTYIGLLH